MSSVLGSCAAMAQHNGASAPGPAPTARGDQHVCTAEQFRAAVLHSALNLAVIDRNGSFAGVSPALCILTQYSERELLGRDFNSLVHPKDRSHRAAMQRDLCNGASGPLVIEIRLFTKHQTMLWVRISATPVPDDAGASSRFLAVVEDIREQKKADNAVRELSTRLLRSQDEERRRIARELHDNTSQNLSALLSLLAAIKPANGNLDRNTRESLAEAITLAKQCVREVRSISYLLHPPLLDHLQLPDALTSYVRGFSRRSGLDVKLQMANELRSLPKEIDTTLYRLIQEGLNNVLQHSGSKRAEIQIECYRHCLVLQMRDFGRGMALGSGNNFPESQQLGVGLLGMRERVEQLGGEFEIHSGNSGTAIRALLPVGEVSQ